MTSALPPHSYTPTTHLSLRDMDHIGRGLKGAEHTVHVYFYGLARDGTPCLIPQPRPMLTCHTYLPAAIRCIIDVPVTWPGD